MGRTKLLVLFVLADDTTMKALSILLIPAIALLVSACASGPVGPVYSGGPGYGPGPSPQAGYYWNGTVYVQGQSPYYHDNQYSRNVTDVNDVNVNRTNINDRTVNNTTVNNKRVNNTHVNNRTVNRTNVNKVNVEKRTTHKPVQEDKKYQQGNQ
jgi:hypothetical protein